MCILALCISLSFFLLSSLYGKFVRHFLMGCLFSLLSVLDTSSSSNVHSANTFPKATACLSTFFPLSCLSFNKQVFDRQAVWCVLFFHVACFLCPTKWMPNPRSQRFAPVLSPGTFVVLRVAFRPKIQFKFVSGVRCGRPRLPCLLPCLLSRMPNCVLGKYRPLGRDTLFLSDLCWPLVENQCTISRVWLAVVFISMSVFLLGLHCLDIWLFIEASKLEMPNPSFSVSLATSRHSFSCVKFSIGLLIPTASTCWHFVTARWLAS